MPRTKREVPDFLTSAFTVIVDSNESAPYAFRNQTQRHSSGRVLPLIVPVVRKPLWSIDLANIQVARGKHTDTHRVGWADYSIDGLHRHIQIERKSLDDLTSTIAGRRGRFEAEIKRLNRDCKAAYVVCECNWSDISTFNADAIQPSPLDDLIDQSDASGDYGSQDDELSLTMDARPRVGGISPAVILGTISRWGIKYRNVHWVMAGSRGMAESLTFKILLDFWNLVNEGFYPDIKIEAAKS